MKITLYLLLTFASFTQALSATYQQQDKYKLNPTPGSTSKDKVYVPLNLEDSFIELKKMLHPDLLKGMKESAEKDLIDYHMGLGMWMRNYWGLWGGSRLAKYFNGIGIFHPDDMSAIILDSFWRHLNSAPIRFEEQVAYYQKFWGTNNKPKRKTCPLDRSLVEITLSLEPEPQKNRPVAIYIGRCKKQKHLWAYEYGKGWYRPDAVLLKRVGRGE